MERVAGSVGLLSALILIGTGGCSTATQLSAGPMVVTSSRRTGAEVLVRAASGFGSERGFGGIEVAGRGFALGEGQGLALGLGPAWFGTWGKHWFTLDADAMLGVGNIRHRPGALGTFRAAFGAGLELTSSASARPQRLLFGGEPVPGVVEVFRNATALTIDVGPTLDFSEAWSPLFSVGLRVGVTWLESRYSVAEPWPQPGGFLLLRPPDVPRD